MVDGLNTVFEPGERVICGRLHCAAQAMIWNWLQVNDVVSPITALMMTAMTEPGQPMPVKQEIEIAAASHAIDLS